MAEKEKINVMVNGLNPDPKSGKMAREIAERIITLDKDRFQLVNASLTGPGMTSNGRYVDLIDSNGRICPIMLIEPQYRDSEVGELKSDFGNFISIDATHPTAVNGNTDFYCNHDLSFIMLTTGGDRKALEERIKNSKIVGLPALNMAAPIVSLMGVMDRYSKENQGAFAECELNIVESHQQGKADTSGTARAMLKYFQKLGIQMDEKLVDVVDKFKMKKPENITFPLGYDSTFTMIRESQSQLGMGIPEEHLQGHGWHEYAIKTNSAEARVAIEKFGNALQLGFFEDNNALENYKVWGVPWQEMYARSPGHDTFLSFCQKNDNLFVINHNINGRSVYVDGTLNLATPYVWKKMQAGEKGKVYSMIDVLKG